MPGPAPKPDGQRRRRNSTPPAIVLPAAGRSGEVPKWPLGGKPPRVWRELWRLPQAVAWERLHLHRVIARYALVLGDAETGDRYLAAEARQLEDRLGLTPMSLLKLRWQIGDDEAGEAARDGRVPNLNDYREAI